MAHRDSLPAGATRPKLGANRKSPDEAQTSARRLCASRLWTCGSRVVIAEVCLPGDFVLLVPRRHFNFRFEYLELNGRDNGNRYLVVKSEATRASRIASLQSN